MKRREVLAGLLAVAASPAALPTLVDRSFANAASDPIGELAKKPPVINDPGVPFGAYDPHGDFKNVAGVKIEHLFLPWQDVDLSTLPIADAYARQRGRSVLITVEPWSWSADRRISPDRLRRGLLAGEFDPTMATVMAAIGSLQSDVTVRFAHEMEDKSGRFTWSGWRPSDYVAAYRRFVEHARPLAPRAKFMWSPEGLDGLADYYPGDPYVDLVGLTVFGLQRFDRDKFGHDRTFAEALKPGYDLVVSFDKPIVVAEVGYVGDARYVADWAESLTRADASFSKLSAVVYFDDKEVHPWPEPYGLPIGAWCRSGIL